MHIKQHMGLNKDKLLFQMTLVSAKSDQNSPTYKHPHKINIQSAHTVPQPKGIQKANNHKSLKASHIWIGSEPSQTNKLSSRQVLGNPVWPTHLTRRLALRQSSFSLSSQDTQTHVTHLTSYWHTLCMHTLHLQ